MSDPSHRDISQPAVDPARSPDSTRRRFLIAFGAGAAASASALAAAPAPIVGVAAPAAASQGYRETEHVRNYYATTRI
jgi:hypothetical protein